MAELCVISSCLVVMTPVWAIWDGDGGSSAAVAIAVIINVPPFFFAAGIQREEDLYVRLIDSSTKQVHQFG